VLPAVLVRQAKVMPVARHLETHIVQQVAVVAQVRPAPLVAVVQALRLQLLPPQLLLLMVLAKLADLVYISQAAVAEVV
jgi:hypothetical protein